jgi:hypothetical protein
MPALDIGVLDQQHSPGLIDDQTPNAQGHAPLKPELEVKNGPYKWLNPSKPNHGQS